MTTEKRADKVSQLLGFCLQDKNEAERIFSVLSSGKENRVTTTDGEIHLDEGEKGEFVARFSAEVEPVFWESKRRKDQI